MANQDFFLSPDDAQTLGNINYMKKSVRVRHTFPKNLKNPNGFEVIKEVSSSKYQSVNETNNNRSEDSLSQSTNKTNSISDFKVTQNSSKSSGTNMDMFRNMARSIRKK